MSDRPGKWADSTGRDILTLFFTAGTSIANWNAAGTLERELAVYRRMLPEMAAVNLVSYGGKQDRKFDRQLSEFNLCPVSWRRRQWLTAAEIVLSHSRSLAASSVFKTNQMRGAIIPVWLKRLYRKKLIVRCGFLHSFFTEKQTDDPVRTEQARKLESTAFGAADMVFVTSDWQRNFVLDRYSVVPEIVKVVPNYVQTELFRPLPSVEKKFDLVYIGRGTEQKNLPSLFEALSRLRDNGRDVNLLMIGSCCDNEELRNSADRENLRVEFAGRIDTQKLSDMMNQARIFVLPSHYEGHPKTLLEAMSCGLACIGTDVEGIREEIDHGRTGLLCEPNGESIAHAVGLLLEDSGLRDKLGVEARKHVTGHFGLDLVAGLELGLIKQLIAN